MACQFKVSIYMYKLKQVARFLEPLLATLESVVVHVYYL